jgi:hypothetical protein
MSLKKKYKSYGILAYCPETNDYIAQTEHSFCMGESRERVRIYQDWEIYYFLNKNASIEEKNKKKNEFLKNLLVSGKKFITTLEKKYNRKFELILFRSGSKTCPIKIDWKTFFSEPREKFNRRNLKFKIKGVE